MKLIAATGNAHKLVEFRRILEPLGFEVLPQSTVAPDLEVEENGTTFEANSLIKAKALFEAGAPMTLADDSGLEVDALQGAPGVYSARYGGEGLDDTGRWQLLLENMKDIPKEQRTARFVSVITLILSEDDVRTYRGECEGWIGFAPKGEDGFGYDPVFMVSEQDSFASLSGAQKDALSHRGVALRKMQEDLLAHPWQEEK